MKKIFSLILILSLLCCCLVACKEPISDNTEHYDKITKKLKLSREYEGKSFVDDGIGKATVDAFTDGDTTRFSLEDGTVVIIRYYQIDTPESTGAVEPWGLAASNFVRQQLTDADIILEATGDTPETDSYGVRYLGYVWYKSSSEKDYKCLNLEMVENGFSENKGIYTSAYPYYQYFNEAEVFAKKVKTRIHSDLDDPLYSKDPIDITIKEFWQNTEAYYNRDSKAGSKVRFTAYLSSVKKADSGTHTFIAQQYDAQDKEVYEINVYAAYDSNPATNMPLGHLYEIVGTVQDHYGTFQITGIKYNSILTLEDGTSIKQRDYYLAFDSNATYQSQSRAYLYTDVTVVSSKVENNVLVMVGETKQRTQEGVADTAVTFEFSVAVAEGFENSVKAGDKFSVYGYQFEAKSGKITILNYEDIQFK